MSEPASTPIARKSVLVVDASVVVAVLVDGDDDSTWSAAALLGSELVAPAVMPFEVGGVLRKRARAGRVDPSAAALAHDRLRTLRVALWPHVALASRAWRLCDNVTYSDACFVALAEQLDAPLVTLDRRLARSPGPRCAFLTPP